MSSGKRASGKSLSERIAERAGKRKPSVAAQNRAVFLALRSEIKQALDDGWPVKTTWETLHEEGKVVFGYHAFHRYVKRLIQGEASQQKSGKKEQGGDNDKPETAAPSSAKPEASGFDFNPTPEKGDLF